MKTVKMKARIRKTAAPDDSTLMICAKQRKALADIMAGIKSGDIVLSIGDSITTTLKNGKTAEFVVTDIDEEAYRFESRDCIGRYDPMTEIDKFFDDMWEALPGELRENIIFTRRYYKTASGELRSSVDKLFLPSASEIFPPEECYGDNGVYEQVEWYKDRHNRVRAFERGGSLDWYWTQSPREGHSTAWCIVGDNGHALSSLATNTGVAAPVCFRIWRF